VITNGSSERERADWRAVIFCALTLAATLLCSAQAKAADPLHQASQAFLDNYCLDCHDADTQKGEINLEFSKIDWSEKGTLFLWERVLNALQSGVMPPKKKRQPKAKERRAMTAWIDGELSRHSTIGGTLARRLNQAEYLATIRSLFDLKNFTLPPGFPADREHHGFDNVGEGLVLSPPLLESYDETAKRVADEIFPPIRKSHKPSSHKAEPKDLVISYSSSKIVDGAMRLGMKCDPIQRSCTWPSRIETEASGVYRFKITLSSFRGAGKPMTAKILARDVASTDGVSHQTLRLLKEIKVTSESPRTFEFEAELYEGQTPVLHWANAILDSDRTDKADLEKFFRNKDEENPRYLAAWHAMLNGEQGQGFRGGIGWERVKKQLTREDLPEISEKEKQAVLKKIVGNPVLHAETVVFDVFENGPALEIHGVEVDGPHRIVDGPRDVERQRLQKQFVGNDTRPEKVIHRFLTAAFRRPVDDETVKAYLGLYDRHLVAGHTHNEAMHLLIRNALISPRFLYRCLNDGPLDDHDLATRLSYFLTGAPPNSRLVDKASAGKLAGALRAEATRLLPRSASALMIKNFTGQWLDTRLLSEIMPDPKFKFLPSDELSAKSEVEHFFLEMLKENRPMTDFIDPDFTWTSGRVAQNVYGLKKGFDKKKKNNIHRVVLPRGGRFGGVLGQAAVMMATANGVDTQPVLRGVWVLENILGTPPPPPPKSVPALTPNTRGSTTPRELLSAHTKEVSCAGCHRQIDPVGFVLENFDPVGRWRTEWPGINHPIDASSILPDGTKIRDIVDFKAWLVKNIDRFSECLAEKLMTYATGRVPNYSERKEIAALVEKNHDTGNGFRDLVLALIASETFRTK
jgi:hypothetical protein